MEEDAMKAGSRYTETPLLERIFSPMIMLLIFADACFVRFWMRIISGLQRIVEKEAIPGAMFVLSALTGAVFVLGVVAQRPELHFTNGDITKNCAAMVLAVIFLKVICDRNGQKIKAFSVECQKEKMGVLQPFRVTTISFLLALAVFGLMQTGKYYHGQWYYDGYFYLTVSTLFSALGVYASSALTYLNMQEKVFAENKARIQELVGA